MYLLRITPITGRCFSLSGKSAGNTGDLFRFDLVRHIMKSVPSFTGFTYVPVRDNPRSAPGKNLKPAFDLAAAVRAGKAGSQNRELGEHLGHIPGSSGEHAYTDRIRAYFSKEKIPVRVMAPSRVLGRPDHPFGILSSGTIPPHSLILVDLARNTKKESRQQDALFFAEIARIYEKMDPASVLMVSATQGPARSRSGNGLRDLKARFKDLSDSIPVTITDDELIFYLLTKNPKFSGLLGTVVERYADTYPTLYSSYMAQ